MWGARLVLLVSLVTGFPALAHEFWIEPEEYQVQPGDPLVASLRNGQHFEGITLGWFDRQFTRFEMVSGDTIRPVEGRMGDTPALQTTAPDAGLLIVLHETTPATLVYTEWDKFLAFAAHKDFPQAAADHEANGWSKERFAESYTRHVKALIAVGDGSGDDRAFGMKTEFVAMTNPYDTNFDGNMKVRVLLDGVPRGNAQVEVFEKDAGNGVEITLYRTDAEGVAEIPVTPGHSYLFDAVVLAPSPQAGTSDSAPVWETYWAALTFAVP
jgi:hypothetical protein